MDCCCQAAVLVLFLPTGLFQIPLKGGDIYAYGLIVQWPLVVSSGIYTAVILAEPVQSACSPLPVNAFNIVGIPILASRVPKNPPCGVLVGLITN